MKDEDFMVQTVDEKYLCDYLLYQVKKKNWKMVITVATDLVEFQSKQDYERKEFSADGGVIGINHAPGRTM